jgi:hypothetical protein
MHREEAKYRGMDYGGGLGGEVRDILIVFLVLFLLERSETCFS